MNANLAQSETAEDGTEISFRPLPNEPGLEIIDPIDRHRYRLQTRAKVKPRRASTDEFYFPVDAAVDVRASEVHLPSVVRVTIHDRSGEVVATADQSDEAYLEPGTYSIGLSAPIKVYLRVDSSINVTSDLFQTSIQLDEDSRITVGARSRHQHPATTITTTEDPEDMMAAVSTFGSALKTTTVERSYPTLRGHPPAVEIGDEVDIPRGLETPETGITVELPPAYESVYVAAPLAYYLGATLEPGDSPRIVMDSGFEYALDTKRRFEKEVECVLKQTFFLDCLTRTEGIYELDLHERSAVEDEIGLDFGSLYYEPITRQVEAYLDVPFSVVEPHLPEWKVTTHVSPHPSSIETLPFLVNDLAVVRTPRTETVASSDVQSVAVNEFFRNDSDFTRSVNTTGSSADAGPDTDFVQPEQTDSLEQVWIGEETPLGVSKATATAYRHRLERAPKRGDIDITVVCNDAEMEAEGDFVDDAYGSREELPFDVSIHQNLTTDELATLLEQNCDFLHYIGHIEPEGFLCSDGMLDASDLDEVGVDAFLLNACASYEQGMALIEGGSIGGVVTLSDVLNSGAVRIGCAMARLLNHGFPLRAAMNVARDESFVGGQYIVVGDGGLAITQAEDGTPMLLEIERNGVDQFTVEVETYPTSSMGLGTLMKPYIEGEDTQYLASGSLNTYQISTDELRQFLSLGQIPLRKNGRLYWSDELRLSEI